MVRFSPGSALISWTLLSLISCSAIRAQPISTSQPVPPLQWINLTQHLSGDAPAPPLRDASIGYDDATRTLIIFGGQSPDGIPQSSTYLIDLETLTWHTPTAPNGLGQSPPPRYAAVSGHDYSASYRDAHFVIGGIGSNGEALSDIWEFDYISTFWSEVHLTGGPGPSARYGAVGGLDPRITAVAYAGSSTPNNTVYLAGGVDGTTVSPLSDLWQLEITGTLSSNNANDSLASWKQLTADSTPPRIWTGGTVVSTQVVAVGGCTTSHTIGVDNTACAQGQSYVLNTQSGAVSNISACPAPRLEPTVVPNFAPGSAFSSQVFVLFGLFNTTLWSDQDGIDGGEVDVLNTDTGQWSRILPSGDPGPNGGTPAFPGARQGAVAVGYQQPMVGTSTTAAADAIIFGGVDADGNYLSDVWVLRAYDGQLTQSNQTWSGYGSGTLAGGVNATGEGVTVQYMTSCASALNPKATETSAYVPTATATGPSSPSSTSTSPPTTKYDTSVIHKALSPISVALVMPAVIFSRLAMPSVGQPAGSGGGLLFASVLLGLAAYALGIAGIATSFTSIVSVQTLTKRSSLSNILKTGHGKAGLALFIAFYGLLPLIFAITACWRRGTRDPAIKESKMVDGRPRLNSNETAEKEGLFSSRVGSPLRRSADGYPPAESRPSESRPRVRSWGGLGSLAMSGRRSNDSEQTAALSSPSRSFEVTNRPARTRRASGNSLAAFSDPRPSGTPRNLSDLSWFDRRTPNEFGYVMNHVGPRNGDPSTPGTTAMDIASTSGLMGGYDTSHAFPEMPSTFDGFFHILFHALLLGLCILSLMALWYRAPRATFIVFLVGTGLFYLALVTLSWYGKPRCSIVSVLIARIRGDPVHAPAILPGHHSRPMSVAGSEVPFPTEHRGPYQHHQPPYRATHSTGLDDYPTSISHGHGTTDIDEDDEDDEDTRQRRIEEEMSRRDVSIVTVPKRKLFLTNPEEDRH
ncbi:hypothetical protein WOLCODRAFT_137227 [Wolfiporia cocos MD-104 SS10]|uniref:Galactose oxidase n=1 Tax=Wolfiporia cocos (strain MD-104) TaxID=742152 RepID=A0A2H3JMN8_WOLCO|nr:hypothetical protein WOLCODRAFT_137227 [Wolfiporia cocos MD-104 SS10]